jgi:DNA-directed RNA polymerase delta subunit
MMMARKSVVSAAEELLRKKHRPMHYREITVMIQDTCELRGQTPYESVRSRIGTSPRFKRVAEGVYALSEWEEYPIARFAKDIAYDILKKRRKPISLIELAQRILEERQFSGSPKNIVQNIVRTDARFYLDKQAGVVGLMEWQKERPNNR